MELLVLISIILIVVLFFFGWKYDEVWMKRFEIFMYDSMKYGFHYSFRHLKNDLVTLWQCYIQKKNTKK